MKVFSNVVRHVLLCFLFFAFFPLYLYAAVNSRCIACHQNLGEKHQKIISDFDNDIHKQIGLSCHSCHGGNPNSDDPSQAKSPDAGFLGKPDSKEIPKFCGRCHSNPSYMKKFNPSVSVDQESKYWTSIHGLKLKNGDTQVANCASCHPAHSIRRPEDPLSSVYPLNIAKTCATCHSDAQRMKPYKIPTDQHDKYMKSVHANALYNKGDISAPTCNDCHGNHGATPPGVESIAFICGHCHALNLKFFMESPMAAPWQKKGVHACATCHNNHDVLHPTLDLLSSDKSICLKCHKAPAKGPMDRGLKVGLEIKGLIENFETHHSTLSLFISEIENKKGMDVSEAQDLIQESRQVLIQSKTALHSFDPGKVREIVKKGNELQKKAEGIGDKAIREFWRRRVGLGIATLFITLLALAIFLTLKEIEKK